MNRLNATDLGATWAEMWWDAADPPDPLWTPHREHARAWLLDNAAEIAATRAVRRRAARATADDEAFCADLADAARARWCELLAEETEASECDT